MLHMKQSKVYLKISLLIFFPSSSPVILVLLVSLVLLPVKLLTVSPSSPWDGKYLPGSSSQRQNRVENRGRKCSKRNRGTENKTKKNKGMMRNRKRKRKICVSRDRQRRGCYRMNDAMKEMRRHKRDNITQRGKKKEIS